MVCRKICTSDISVCILSSVREEKLQPNHTNLWQIHHSQMILKRDSYMPCEAMALSTKSAIDTIYSGQSIYSWLNAELVLSGHSIQDGDCPMFGYLVGFRTPAGVGWLDRNGVLSSRVGGSQWSKSTERCEQGAC